MARSGRLAANEALFRSVNERLRERAARAVGDDAPVSFLCECAELDCSERVQLTLADYEGVRSDPAQFVVRLEHVARTIEHVVRSGDDYAVVRKEGDAAAVAEEMDPRA